jgi:hypothetical protein
MIWQTAFTLLVIGWVFGWMERQSVTPEDQLRYALKREMRDGLIVMGIIRTSCYGAAIICALIGVWRLV